MTLLAVRFIDLAIFGTLGTLWIAGGVFVFLLWRWIIRRERAERPTPEVPHQPIATPAHRETSVVAPAAKPFTLAHG